MSKNIFLSGVAAMIFAIIPVSATSAVAADLAIIDQSVKRSLPNNAQNEISSSPSSSVKADGDQKRDRLRETDKDCIRTKDCDQIVDSETNPDPDRQRDQERVVDPLTDPDQEQDRIVDPDVVKDRDQERIIDPPDEPIRDRDRDQDKLSEPGNSRNH